MTVRTGRPTSATGRIRAALLALAACLSVGFNPAAGQAIKIDLGQEPRGAIDPALLVGEWTAVLQGGNYPQPVTLRIDQVTPGKTAGKMTYSNPRRCVVDLEYGGPHEDRHIFYIIRFTNCFDYEKTDFVALAATPDPAEVREQAREEERKQREEERKQREEERKQRVGTFASLGVGDAGKAETGTGAAPEQAPAQAPSAAPPDKITHIRYSIVLGGKERETAVLARR